MQNVCAQETVEVEGLAQAAPKKYSLIPTKTFTGKEYWQIDDLNGAVTAAFEGLTANKLRKAGAAAIKHYRKQTKRKIIHASVWTYSGLAITLGICTMGTIGLAAFPPLGMLIMKEHRADKFSDFKEEPTDANCHFILNGLLQNDSFGDDSVSHKAFFLYFLLEEYLEVRDDLTPNKWVAAQRVEAVFNMKIKSAYFVNEHRDFSAAEPNSLEMFPLDTTRAPLSTARASLFGSHNSPADLPGLTGQASFETNCGA